MRTKPWVDLAFAPLACAASWALLFVRGIPITHDGLGIERIEAYRRAYRAGDFFPVWTPFMSDGHGSPFPILYHRLHGQVFGALALLTGTLAALKISVPLLLVLGAAGMRRLCLGRGVRPWVAWVAGALFLSSHYVWCDWFVRGATAELMAFMIAPWCIHHALQMFEERESPIPCALWSVFLFYAHMMTAYFFAYLFFTVFVARLVRMRSFGWRRSLESFRRAAVYSALVLAFVGPLAGAVQYAVEFSKVNAFGMRSDNAAYLSWSATLFDPNFTWFRAVHPGEFSVEIGRWPMFFCAAALLVDRRVLRDVWDRTYGLLVPLVVFFVLQDKRLAFVFDLVPGASKIQFPCRLLAWMVPIALLAFGLAIESAMRSRAPAGRWIGALSPLAVAAQLSVVMQAQRDIREKRYEEAKVEVAIWDPDMTKTPLEVYSTWDGFLPEGFRTLARSPFLLASNGCTLSSSQWTHGAKVATIEDTNDFTAFSFTVHGTGCSVRFSQFRTPLLAIEIDGPGAAFADTDHTTVIDVPRDGTEVHVRQRTILELASKWMREKWSGAAS